MAAPTVRGRTTPAAGLSATSPVATVIGDVVICWTWERQGSGIPDHTLQANFVEIRTHGHNDGSADGRLSVAYKIATVGGASSYQAYTSSHGTNTWTGIIVLDPATVDLTALAHNSVTSTTNVAPDPPSVTLNATRDWLVVAVGCWYEASSTPNTIGAPTNYGNLQRNPNNAVGFIATAERALLAAASEDPGAFTDSTSPSGTVGATFGFPSPPPPANLNAALLRRTKRYTRAALKRGATW